MQSKDWSIFKLIRFTLLFLFFCFVVAEIIFRIQFDNKYKGCSTTAAIQGNTIQMADKALIFKNRPFYTDYDLKFQFNEEGMKSRVTDAYMPVKTENDFWVFLFGASAMEGMGSNKTGSWIDITGIDDYPWNETVAASLGEILQKKMPQKKITVFCAANSSYSIYQSLKRYELLSEKYKIDWVVSLDGNNEPSEFDKDKNIKDIISEDWKSYPIHRFPTTFIIPFTTNSVFINTIKQFVYTFRHQRRMKNNVRQQFPQRYMWYNQSDPGLKYDTANLHVKRAATEFLGQIKKFDSILSLSGQKHLLLVQPHLSLRNITRLTDTTERALFNYYTSAFNDAKVNGFQYLIHQPSLYQSGDIVVLNYLHEATFPVFVDYCHLTSLGNLSLARFIADKISSNP